MQRPLATGRNAIRATATAVYLAGTCFWWLLMGIGAALRCDDNCLAPEYVDSWRETTDAWQWEAIEWLGAAGALVALAAVVAGWFWRKAGLGFFAAHVAVFGANLFVLLHGADIHGGGGALVLGIAVVAAAGFVAVNGWSPSDAGRGGRAASLEP